MGQKDMGSKTLHASCHCGAVGLEVRPKPRQLTDCNCSICRRYGALWCYYAGKSVKVIVSEPIALTAYSWGTKALKFQHCNTCGCVVYHERSRKHGDDTRIGVNARLMDPAEIANVRVRKARWGLDVEVSRLEQPKAPAMAAPETVALIERYYAAFNGGDSEAMLACLSEDVVHDVNQGRRRSGKDAFREFTRHMERCYAEQLEDIAVMATPDGTRAAAEFLVLGTYIETDEALPPASGQTYRLSAGTFFEVRDGLITRLTTYYNLAEWLAQIAAPKP